MSNDNKNILNSVKQMKNVFKDISQLLETVEDFIKKEWIPAWGNTCITDSSNSIKNPEKWIPNEIFRFYKNKNDAYRLCFVSVLLDDDVEPPYTLSEPLVTAGYFDFGKKEISDKWYFEWSRSYGYTGNMKHDGKPVPFKVDIPFVKKNAFTFDSGKGFGWPLTSITNPDDIQNKIIEPLLKLLKENK